MLSFFSALSCVQYLCYGTGNKRHAAMFWAYTLPLAYCGGLLLFLTSPRHLDTANHIGLHFISFASTLSNLVDCALQSNLAFCILSPDFFCVTGRLGCPLHAWDGHLGSWFSLPFAVLFYVFAPHCFSSLRPSGYRVTPRPALVSVSCAPSVA